MKESIGADLPPGHVYTAEEVRVRLSRLEEGMRDLGVLGNRHPFSGLSGFSGVPGHPGLSGFSGRRGSASIQPQFDEIRYKQNPYADPVFNEGFMAKGIRELKEYFQALFVKTLNKKEIEHG